MGMTTALQRLPLLARFNRETPQGLLDARVTHVRHSPKRHELSYRVWYLHVDLDELDRLDRPFLHYNRRGIFSLHDADYGQDRQPLRTWLERAFASAGATLPTGARITLLTMPRALGFGFNPVSFWLVHDADGQLVSVLAEVNNTFGERHCYLCRRPDGEPIRPQDRLTAEKVFHVSPFLPVDGHYVFRFHERQDGKLAIFITLVRDGRDVLFASIAGDFAPLSSRALAWRFVRQPLPAMRVVMLIHYHAARLYLKGLRYFSKPAAPTALVTETTAPDTSTYPNNGTAT